MAQEGFDHYHIPQQSRREKLRVLSQNQTLQTLPFSHSSSSPLPNSLYDSNFMMRFAPSSSSNSYLDPEEAIQVITNTNPFLYQSLQNLREFNNNNDDNDEQAVMVLKHEPLSLSLSSNNNFQRYGGGGSVVYGGFENNHVSRNTVPLGPFTGYASVLKGSRFLKPAQQLLDEICDVGVRGINSSSHKFSADACLMMEESSSTVHESLSASNGINGDNDDDDHHGNEGRNKSRLLAMLDEIYRRYRQYYQQIHAVVTSFEYVAGLGNAAPYASLAINTMSKHFRLLKNAITEQLQFISKSHFRMSNRKDESQRFRNCDVGPYNQRQGLPEHQTPVWRPQRGLPERAVSVLRAWLFEHFLHPYPTDTDKLMLAKQTGLSRNQVSNWFINARVRLWKPMVEEIHMLESQQTQKKSSREEHSRNNLSDHLPSDNNFPNNPSTATDKFQDVAYKRTRNELPNMPVRSQEQQHLINQQVNVGVSNGNGVSLTLGLHQNHGIGLSEPFSISAAQRFGLAIQPDQGYVTSGFQSQNRQFGVQMLHDFVG